MKIKVFQKGFNYSQDGTGNRLVYHLQGCNMHCAWCSNPEGIAVGGTLVVNNAYLLSDICPHHAIYEKQINRSLCEKCESQECIMHHKTKGIHLSCEDYEINEILNEAKRCTALFYDGGGVTLSGGEATLQFDSISILLRVLKAEGIHTAIETNASHPKLDTLFPFIDLLIMDFKHYDNEVHHRATDISNAIIKENVIKALTSHPKVLIRIPLIKGFNDLQEDAKNFAAFFKQYDTQNVSFEFLPYHEYGKTKWEQCGMTYTMQDAYVDTAAVAFYEETFSKNNLLVIHT